MGQRLQNDVAIVVCFYIVHSNNPRRINSSIYRTGHFLILLVQVSDVPTGENRIQHILNIVQRRIDNLVIVRQAIELQRGQVQKHVMRLSHRVRVSVCIGSPSLEILSAHQTGVDIDPSQRNRTELLEIEIQQMTVDRIQVGTQLRPGFERRIRSSWLETLQLILIVIKQVLQLRFLCR